MLTDSFTLAGINFSVADIESGLAPQVRVEQVGATSVLQVRVESPSPRTATALAETIPQVYLGYVRTTRQAEATSALTALEKRLQEENVEFGKAEHALNEFKRSRNLLPLAEEAGIRSQKLSGMETEANRARAAVASADERLRSLLTQRSALPKSLRDNAFQANSQQIEAQKGAIAELKARRDALLVQYLPTHQQVQEVEAQITAAEQRLAEIPKEIDQTSTSMHPEILRLDARIADARAELKGAQAESAGITRYLVQSKGALEEFYALEPKQQVLARVVEDRRTAILNMSRSLDELRVRSSAARDPVTVLTPASAATKARPNELQYLAVALLAGLFFAVVFAAAKDGHEERVISADELAFESQLEVLGEVPVNKQSKRPVGLAGLGEAAQEVYRQLRYRMLLAGDTDLLRGTLFLAGCDGTHEGVPELAAHLAIGFASQQRSVIIVDADLRCRAVSKWLDGEPAPGLTEVIRGETSIDQVLQKTPYDGVRMVAAGARVINPTDLLSIPAARSFFEDVKAQADLVIVVGPTFTEAADAEILASYVDTVALVARLEGTPRRAFTTSLVPLRRASTRRLGVVLTRATSRSRLRS